MSDRPVPSSSLDVTPHDTNAISATPIDGLYILTTGDVVAQLRGDSSNRTYTGLAANVILEGDFEFVRATGTTATMFAYPRQGRGTR